MDITLSAFATVNAEARNVGDLRALVKYLNTYQIPDEAVLDWGYGKLYVDLPSKDGKVTWIECGDHLAGDETHDILIETHKHEEDACE